MKFSDRNGRKPAVWNPKNRKLILIILAVILILAMVVPGILSYLL